MTAKLKSPAKKAVKGTRPGPVPTGKTARKQTPMEYEYHFGNVIRLLIKEKGLLQLRLANVLSISTNGMNNKLNSPSFGSIYDIVKASEFLDIDLFEVLSRAFANKEMPVFKKSLQGINNQLDSTNSEIEMLKKENYLLQELLKLKGKSKK